MLFRSITTFPGRAPEDVERQVTIPIEIVMRGVPKVDVIRSRTIFGLAVVQMMFEEGTESYWARQRVQEKLATLQLPEGAKADLGPLATAYGEVFRYELTNDGSVDVMKVREVEAGEQQGGDVDIYTGLKAGERLIGQGSILLKPYIVQATTPVGKDQQP